MSKRNIVLRFGGVLIALVAVWSIVTPLAVRSQDNPELIAAAIEAARSACRDVGRDQLCFGSAGLEATLTDGATFEKAGDVADATKLQSLSGAAGDADQKTWGIAIAKLAAGLPEAGESTLALAALGATTLTNSVNAQEITVCTAKNINKGELNIFTGPALNRPVVGTLAELEKVTANGRTEASDWLRIERNGVLGWVTKSSATVNCELNTLPVGKEGDYSVLYRQPLQAFTLDTQTGGVAPNGLLVQSPLEGRARLLVNGVQIDTSGAAFLTANADALVVNALQGEIVVTATGKSVTLKPGLAVTVPLSDQQPSASPADAVESKETVGLIKLLNSLVFGQPYAAADEKPSLNITSAVSAVAPDEFVKVKMSFTGDSAICPQNTVSKLVDLVFAIDTSDNITPSFLSGAQSGVAEFMQNLRPQFDLVGAVGFSDGSKLVSPFGPNLRDAADGLSNLTLGGGAAMQEGLGKAYTELKAGRRADSTQAIILITDAAGSPEEAQTQAKIIKDAGIRLIAIGIGQKAKLDVLKRLASDEQSVYSASSVVGLRKVLNSIRLDLVSKTVAARDLTLTYKLNAADYELVQDLLELSGGVAKGADTVEWKAPVVRGGETIEFPLVVKPRGANGGKPIGSAQLAYLACGEGGNAVKSPALAAPSVKVDAGASSGDIVSAQNGILTAGKTGEGAITAFGAQNWILNVPGDQIVSVITEGVEGTLNAAIANPTVGTISPLYTLENFDGNKRNLSVFYLPKLSAGFLFVQSSDDKTAGKYRVTVQAGLAAEAKVSLALDGDPVEDKPTAREGLVYNIPGAKGDRVTLRWQVDSETAGDRLDVVALDGKVLEPLARTIDNRQDEQVYLYSLDGAGPFVAVVKANVPYQLRAESGDTLTNARGPIQIGETRDKDAKNTAVAVFTYDLNLETDQIVSLILSGAATSATIRDEANQSWQPQSQTRVNNYNLALFDLKTGKYTIYVPTQGRFGISVAEGDVTRSLKGSLGLGETKNETLRRNERLAVYNIIEGSKKPLADGDVVTISLDGENVGEQNVYIESADGDRALTAVRPIVDVLDRRNRRLVIAFEIKGKGPYRIIVTGLNRFLLRLDQGDLLSADKGALVVGQTARDSSRSPQYIIYTLAPELGKDLVDGDIVTVDFLNQANSEKPFFRPFLQDAKQTNFTSTVNFSSQRQFVGLYTLQGPAPYRLVIPNIGAYVVTVSIGNQLEREQGDINIGDTLQGTTSGPQLVYYNLNAEEGRTFTATLNQGRGGVGTFLRYTVKDADGKTLRAKWQLGANRFVYDLVGKAPYRISFQINGAYEFKLEDGDKLTLDQGKFFMGDAELTRVRPELGSQFVVYQLDVQANQTITVQVGNRGFTPDFFLLDPRNRRPKEIETLDVTRDSFRTRQKVYRLRQAGVYRLAFVMNGEYSIRVSDGDQLKLVKGNAFWNVIETDRLPADKLYATYTLNAEEGQVVTLEYAPSGRGGSLTSAEITNARDELLYSQDALIGGGYLAELFTLTGPGPYTLRFQPIGEYRLRLNKGDIFNIDLGALAFDQETTDSPYPPREPGDTAVRDPKRMVYTIEAEAGSAITVQLTQPERSQTSVERLVDSEGNDIFPNAERFDTRTDVRSLSYTLVGPGPYKFTFQVDDEYKIQVTNTDLLVVQQGDLAYDQEVENELAEPGVIAAYTVNGKAGDVVSLTLEQASDPLFTNAKGLPVSVRDVGVANRATAYIYQLIGDGPYRLQFRPNRRYTVNLNTGNRLIIDLGALTKNAAASLADPQFRPENASGSLDAPGKYGSFTIDGQPDDIITVVLQTRARAVPLLTSSDNRFVDSEMTFFGRDNTQVVYKLKGQAPYKLLFDAPDRYDVTLYEGDTLRFDAGTLPTGVQEEPYKNTLPGLARIAVHTLDVAPGQLVTLQLQNRRNQIDAQLRDGNNKLIPAVIRDFQGGQNNVLVYILSGSGPYKLSFVVDGEYTAIVAAANLLRVDKGIIPFGAPVEDELAEPGRVADYLVDGKRDQFVTVQLASNNQPLRSDFRDANGKLWLPELQIAQNNALYKVYRLGGPGPYELLFAPTRQYNVTVTDGNILRADLGSIALGAETTNRLEAPTQTAVYTIDAVPGETVSTAIRASGRAVIGRVFNADNEEILPKKTAQRNNIGYAIYELGGKAPYRLEFNAGTNQYNITVSEGNILRSEEGEPPFEERVTKSLQSPAQIAVYTINARPGQLISTQLQISGRPADSTLLNADGKKQEPVATVDKLNSKIKIYRLTDGGAYTLEFDALSQYNLTVSRGNVLRADQGVIRFDNTVTDTLTQPADAAIYAIDGQPGEVISLQLQDRNRPIDSELRDADDKLVLPYGKVNTNNATFSVYKLDGTPPYKVMFIPGGRYSMTLKRGNFFRVELGVIPFGQTANDRLPVPGRTAVYTLKTTPNQVISVQIVNRGRQEFIRSKLVDASGNVVPAIREVFDGTATSTSVFNLTGDAPYSFEFDVTGNYTITFSRGDTTDPKLKQVGPPEQPVSPK